MSMLFDVGSRRRSAARRTPQRELVVDLFSGGGGASLGIEMAIGRPVDIAIDRNQDAIDMHAANHPHTIHVRSDLLLEANPKALTAGQDVGLVWLSPDCRHFSIAKGGTPVSPAVRALAWVAVKWAKAAKPRVIILENVREFLTWGPLNGDKPCPHRKGELFKKWLLALHREGYETDFRALDAADYGVPTHRKRLFLVARRDGQPIRWPEPTHGPGRGKPWRMAAECIDWSLPCRSIFARERPLAEATMKRIARGIKQFVIDASEPFILQLTHGGRLVPLTKPLPTITCAKRGELALVAPYMIPVGYGERQGQLPRTNSVTEPIGTVVASGKHHLVAAFLAKHYGGATGSSVRLPMPTMTATATQTPLVYAFLTKYYGRSVGQTVSEPLHSITTKDRLGLVTVTYDGTPYAILRHLTSSYVIADIGMRMLTPRELAAAQGFPADYILSGHKTNDVARLGNAVCPPVARAIVAENYADIHDHPAARRTLRPAPNMLWSDAASE